MELKMKFFTFIVILFLTCFTNSVFSQKSISNSVINPFNCEAYLPSGWISHNNQEYLFGNASIDYLTPSGLFFVRLNREEKYYNLLAIKNQFFPKPIYASENVAEFRGNILTLTINRANKFGSYPNYGILCDDYIPMVIKLDTLGNIISQSFDSISIRKKTIDGTIPALCKNDKNEVLQAFHYVDLKDSMIKVIVGQYDSTGKFLKEFEPLKFPIDSIKKLGLHSIIFLPDNIIYKDNNYYICGQKRTWITQYEFKIEMFYCALNSDFSIKFYKEIIVSDPNYRGVSRGSNILFSEDNLTFLANYSKNSNDTSSPTNKLFIINKSNGEIIYQNLSNIYPLGKYFECSDGNYLISGSKTPTENYDGLKNASNGSLIKVDKNFKLIWSFPPMYPDKYNDSFNDVIEIEPNVYSVLGRIDEKVSLVIISDIPIGVSEKSFSDYSFSKKGGIIYFKSNKAFNPKAVLIHDILGKKVFEMSPNQNVSEIEIPLNNLPTGAYFISVIADGGQFTKKFVVE